MVRRKTKAGVANTGGRVVRKRSSSDDSKASSPSANIEKKPKHDEGDDEILENLKCVICLSTIYRCVSIQPCMHSYCAACLSSWLDNSKKCPQCQCRIQSVSRNHLTDNVIEAYLVNHGGRPESSDELRKKDRGDKIGAFRQVPDDSFASSNDDSDEEWTDAVDLRVSSRRQQRDLPSALTPLCRECRGATVGGNVPSGSERYVCAPHQAHIQCMCCHEYLPDRRIELFRSERQQTCTLCQRFFCHAYWGCRCHDGCLFRLSAIPEPANTRRILLNNETETDYLKHWMSIKGYSFAGLINEMVAYARDGRYMLSSSSLQTPESLVCADCGHKELSKFLLFLRKRLSDDDAYKEAEQRPKCYWGSNCWTQVRSEDHARKYNHIADQTRFNQ